MEIIEAVRNRSVIEFLDNLDHPLKSSMKAVREIILNVDDSITEHIKWNAPSFCFGGDDKITFNIRRNEIFLPFSTGEQSKRHESRGKIVDDAAVY